MDTAELIELLGSIDFNVKFIDIEYNIDYSKYGAFYDGKLYPVYACFGDERNSLISIITRIIESIVLKDRRNILAVTLFFPHRYEYLYANSIFHPIYAIKVDYE